MKGKTLPIIIVALIAAGAGYFLFFRGGTSPLSSLPGSTQKVTEAMFANIDDPLLRKHFTAQTNQLSFRSTTSDPNLGQTVNEVQIKGDTGYFRLTTGGSSPIDMITIGNTIYAKDFSDNSWWQQTTDENPQTQISSIDLPPVPADLATQFAQKDPTNYEDLGEEACGNLTCHQYRETDPDFGPGWARTFWFDTKDLLLRKEQVGLPGESAPTEYSYDNIDISKPSPTKPVPEGQDISTLMFGIDTSNLPTAEDFDLGEDAPGQEEINQLMEQFGGELPN